MTQPLIQPFRAIRPAPGRSGEIAAPPYDVVTVEEARAQAADRPFSFLHVSRAEIDLAFDGDPHAAEVYAKASENMAKMLDTGALIREPRPSYYAYRMTLNGRVQTGFAAAASIAAYEHNRVRRHELTRPDKETDRTRHIESVRAHTGPVMVVHHPDTALSEILSGVTAAEPVSDVVTVDGARHQIWVIDHAEDIARTTQRFEAMEAIYIADGHHRSAAAARASENRHGSASSTVAPASDDRFLVVSFPTDEVRILDYNRVVKDLNDLSPGAFLSALHTRFVIGETEGITPLADRGTFDMYLQGRWYRLILREPPAGGSSPLERLDVSLLTKHLLAPILGIGDPRLDPRIDFVGGRRGRQELERRVDCGEWAVAFALFPTALEDLMAVADSGQIMPPKSTWFEPKLADGLLSLPID